MKLGGNCYKETIHSQTDRPSSKITPVMQLIHQDELSQAKRPFRLDFSETLMMSSIFYFIFSDFFYVVNSPAPLSSNILHPIMGEKLQEFVLMPSRDCME